MTPTMVILIPVFGFVLGAIVLFAAWYKQNKK